MHRNSVLHPVDCFTNLDGLVTDATRVSKYYINSLRRQCQSGMAGVFHEVEKKIAGNTISDRARSLDIARKPAAVASSGASWVSA